MNIFCVKDRLEKNFNDKTSILKFDESFENMENNTPT